VTRRVPPLLPGLLGAAGALLALSTLGLTWVRRSVEGPLGDAAAAQAEALSGRDVAPLVAAVVPGVAAVVVVGLLLRGTLRVLALSLASLGAALAALAAVDVALTPVPGDAVTTVPWVSGLACALVAVAAATAAVLSARPVAPSVRPVGTAARDDAPSGAAAGASPPTAAELWRAQDEGRDPT
jgi:hypothetical protein